MDLKNRYVSATLRNKVDVYAKKETMSPLGKVEFEYGFVKSVFCSVRLVRKRVREAPADTQKALLSHEIFLRAESLPEIDETYRFKYKDLLLQAQYIEYDFDREGTMIVFCEQVVE